MPKTKTILAADLFCGAGGTSEGLAQACAKLGLGLKLMAINHWQVAIDTHSANHPAANHRCESLDNVDPRKAVPSGRLNLLVASPECTHHSNARGGKPMSDQSRASAWHILRWAEALYIENIIIENVKEFRSWGPLGSDGRPLKRLKGELYLKFLDGLRALGYTVEDRVLNCADYGDPTTRERLFIIARRGGRKINWPAPTHFPAEHKAGLFGRKAKPWRTAREIIDWSLPGESIFARKRPLAPKTLSRIAAGLKKFGGPNAEPFLVVLRNHGAGRSIDSPAPTITAGGNHVGLCEPFVIPQQSKGSPRSVGKPVPTIATKGAVALVEPFLINAGGPKMSPRSLRKPMNTVLTRDHMGVVEPFLIGAGGPSGTGRPRSVNKPMKTVMTENHAGLVEPFLVEVNHGEDPAPRGRAARRARSLKEPMPTVTCKRNVALIEPFLLNIDHHGGNGRQVRPITKPVATQTTKARTALVEPFLVPYFGERKGQKPRNHSVDKPVPAVTSHGAGALVEPFIVKYFGTGEGVTPSNSPVPTITTKDRFALVTTEHGQFYVDIRFRMLQPHELAKAQGFPEEYKFTGNRVEVVKQIGNAVPVQTAKALCLAVLKG